MQTVVETGQIKKENPNPTVYRILFIISFVHLLNDSVQSVIPAIFPILKESMNLSFFQLGLITFALNMTASMMQPLVGLYTDKKPSPYLLPLGMASTLLGMLGLAFATNFFSLLLSVVMVGLGSAVFHPEGSRVVYMAAGDRRGLAQSIFQVGGNGGQSLAPIMTALIFVPLGQFGAIWFTLVAGLAIIFLFQVAAWSTMKLVEAADQIKARQNRVIKEIDPLRKKSVSTAMILLIFLVFARTWYHAGVTNYYPFYLIQEYGLSIEKAQIFIFLFLASGAVGTFLGGPLSDRFGKRNVLMFSMVGATPLALILPHVPLEWAYPLFILNGFIILSSFSVTVVYAQELMPGRVGMVSGLVIGLAFGLGGLGSLAIGGLADIIGIRDVMILCGFLPFIGLFSFFLPSDQKLREWAREEE